jgi:glutathione S-transferase
MPFGKAPVLEVDGELLAQSTTIARYLARQFGIAGKTEWDMALADMYIECIADFVVAYTPLYYEQDAEKLKQLEDKFVDEVCSYLEKIEIRLEKNGSGFLVGPEVICVIINFLNFRLH